jgi:DNA-binding protein HU-beta
MNKNDLVASIASSAKISKRAAEEGLNGGLSSMLAAIIEGKRVTLTGFGSFSIVERGPRTGRNPKTGETVPIPSRRVVKFRPGRELSVKIQ